MMNQQALAVGMQLRIDSACDQFESEWLAGVRPRIEEYLHRSEVGDRLPLAEALIALDLEYRRKAGETPTPSEYLAISGVDPDVIDRIFAVPSANARIDEKPSLDPVPGFELLGELGRGGIGVVYKARQTKLNRTVALKLMLGAGRVGPKEMIRFLAEAEAVAALDHTYVVRVYE